MANNHYSKNKYYTRITLIATLLALVVIGLGAYTRLKDAGLGCPDWPGCYGRLVVPETPTAIQKADRLYPAEPVQPSKAWPEMVHRYFAGTLAVVILGLAGWSLARRRHDPTQPLLIPLLLVAIVVFQAALGMWTVTLELLPLVVMGHLLGGMTIAALLWWLTLRSADALRSQTITLSHFRPWAALGLLILAAQIFLGGWTTANYSSLACAHFPFCQGRLFPHLELSRAFNFLSPIGTDYQGGVLGIAARITIQMFHRYGAFITAGYLGILAICLMTSQTMGRLRGLGWTMFTLLWLQFCLGVMNVELLLPLPVAIAHNLVAALLLLTMVSLIYKLYSQTSMSNGIYQRG
ncbi:MAG: COX15/CtaA family protein [Gammaproteobacteria bacterium]